MTLAEPRVDTEPRVHRWTREEYGRMGEAGLFDGRRVELIEGQVLEMSPMGTSHATGVSLAEDALRDVFGRGWTVRVQMPLAIGEQSEPQPDLAVVPGHPRDYRAAHPTTATLVVEVSDTTLQYDRTTKASLYASAGAPEYWIENLVERTLEVYREPASDPTQPFGYRYSRVVKLLDTDTVAPLAKPDRLIGVVDLLP